MKIIHNLNIWGKGSSLKFYSILFSIMSVNKRLLN